jgi:integrase
MATRSRDRDGIQKLGPRKYRIPVELGRGVDGKRRREHFTVNGTLEQAKARKAELLALRDRGQYVTRQSDTLGVYIAGWLASVRHNLSPTTWERYRAILSGSIVPELGATPLQRLTPQTIRDFETRALDAGLAPATVRQRHNVLRSALQAAVTDGIIPTNPASSVKAPPAKRHDLHVLEEDALGDLLVAMQGASVYVPVVVAAFTGARLGEVLALKWADVDLDAGSMTIRRSLIEHHAQDRAGAAWWSFKAPKSGKTRCISIDAPLVVFLKAHRADLSAQRLRLGVAWSDVDLVAPAAFGEPVRPSTVSRRFAEIVKQADQCQPCKGSGVAEDGTRCPACDGSGSLHRFEGTRFHDLRHAHASILLRRGEQPLVVSRRLGHSTVSFTLDVYGHLIPDQDASAARTFTAAVLGGRKAL